MQGTKAAIKEGARELPHILVVDDEKSICELLEITFRKEGHRVEVANSTEAAKRKLESQIFDIIISDIRMPGEVGVTFHNSPKQLPRLPFSGFCPDPPAQKPARPHSTPGPAGMGSRLETHSP